MDMAVMSGSLRLPGFDIDPDRYYESKWIAPAAQFVDPQKEAEAYKSLVRSGIMTLSQVISLHGGDFEEVMRQRQHELAMLDELGIVTDTDPSAVTKAGQAQNPPIEDTEHPEIHES
jgi:capsid protein